MYLIERVKSGRFKAGNFNLMSLEFELRDENPIQTRDLYKVKSWIWKKKLICPPFDVLNINFRNLYKKVYTIYFVL